MLLPRIWQCVNVLQVSPAAPSSYTQSYGQKIVVNVLVHKPGTTRQMETQTSANPQ